MDERRRLGDEGERLAEVFLRSKGYEILARNYRTRMGEIDLIARDGDEVVFVEVKARRGSAFGYPEEAVDTKKLRKLFRTAERYLQEFDLETAYRFDVVAIESQDGTPRYRHLKNVELDL